MRVRDNGPDKYQEAETGVGFGFKVGSFVMGVSPKTWREVVKGKLNLDRRGSGTSEIMFNRAEET